MAIFDPVEQRLCIRIVYDGVGGAGKTTNLRSLCNLFASQRATELFSPGEAEGRTLYFDWVQIMAGAICGFPLMCQIISVPGQAVLTPRRRYLVETADVIVFVCDSDRAGIDRARQGIELLDSLGRKVPLLVQANKQDGGHALTGRAVVEGLGRDAPVIEAIATDGVGVVDTFVAAVRAVSHAMQAARDAGELDLAVGRAPVPADVLARLQRAELDPEWAAEMFLEEAYAAILVDGGLEPRRAPVVARQAAPSFPRGDVEAGFIWPAHTARRALGEIGTLRADEELAVDENGVCELVVGDYRLRTTHALRYEDREEARQALVCAARERTQLDQALVANTMLVLQPARDGAIWLWTVRANAPSVAEVLAATEDRRPLLEQYAAAVADVLRTAARHGLSVDVAPRSFGVVGTKVYYFGNVARNEAGSPTSVVDAMDDVARNGWESDVFLEAFERELVVRRPTDEPAAPRSVAARNPGDAVDGGANVQA